jgi:hypothetical protein
MIARFWHGSVLTRPMRVSLPQDRLAQDSARTLTDLAAAVPGPADPPRTSTPIRGRPHGREDLPVAVTDAETEAASDDDLVPSRDRQEVEETTVITHTTAAAAIADAKDRQLAASSRDPAELSWDQVREDVRRLALLVPAAGFADAVLAASAMVPVAIDRGHPRGHQRPAGNP